LKSGGGVAILATMDPTEAAAMLAANLAPAAPSADDAASDADAAPADPPATTSAPAAEEQDSADTLSPAVRRLVRQYDLDITGIHGTGPAGRIRVGDVIGMLGGRAAEPPPRMAEAARRTAPDSNDGASEAGDERLADAPYRETAHGTAATPAEAATSAITSTVFECDLSRVLSHRKKQRGNNTDLLLTSYFVVACAEASRTTAELTDGRAARFGVQLTAAEGLLHSLFVATEDLVPGSLDERVRAVDAKLRAGAELATANLLVHHYGASGSLLATPTPIGAGHAGSIGIGRVRREIVVRTADDGDEAPRVAARCYVTLSFLPERIALQRANQFLAHAIRILEQWPE
jgi:2-oxoglutarate dehydrogenase E2 component (dihydrolipoamide succinyltransferase)